jgi:alanyl-tRNA synthetase
MSHSRAPEDPRTLRFSATVEEATPTDQGTAVVLSETYFYPAGGGQPADRGRVGGAEVRHVRSDGDGVVHELAATLGEGEEVDCAVDPDFRRYCMRAHTASHVLYGAGRRLLDDLGYGGFGIDEEKVRVDFTTSTDIDDATLVELERLVNRVVWESRQVTWETLPREEALAREDVAFNTKTEEGIAGDEVRIVTVEGWDVAACGGTHVPNTREVGPVSVLSRSNPGEGLTRVEFAVGPRGVERRTTEKRAALDAAGLLGTNVEDLTDAIERLREEREELRAEVDALQGRVVAAELADAPTFSREGVTWLVATLDLDANELAEVTREHAGDRADVLALVAPDGTLAVASACEVDAGEVVADVTDEFGGGGGGSPEVAQGGGLPVGADEVVAYLER